MKNILTSTLLLTVLSLVSTAALAHSGHLSDESVHGFLHVEHIAVFVAIGVIAYLLKVLRNK
jgi:hydrogenase/urease accessory protein HupE